MAIYTPKRFEEKIGRGGSINRLRRCLYLRKERRLSVLANEDVLLCFKARTKIQRRKITKLKAVRLTPASFHTLHPLKPSKNQANPD
jgi:hypothetical protein